MLAACLLFLFFAAIAVSLIWRKLALSLEWADIPNERSSHDRPVPGGAGLGFALAFLCVAGLLAWRHVLHADQAWLALLALCLALVGLVDDVRRLGVLPRLMAQSVSVSVALLIISGDLNVSLLPPGELNLYVMYGIVALGWVWLINLYNFMDGIDGLAASEAVFVALALAWFAMEEGLYGNGLLMLGLAVIMAGFLCFNSAPASLFMGDAGSNFLGFILAGQGLVLVMEGAISIWTLLILFGVFVSDATSTLLKRMHAGLVWYHAHRSHAYQLAAKAWRSHSRVVAVVAGINLCWLLPLAWVSRDIGASGALICVVALTPLLAVVSHCHSRFLTEGMQ